MLTHGGDVDEEIAPGMCGRVGRMYVEHVCYLFSSESTVKVSAVVPVERSLPLLQGQSV